MAASTPPGDPRPGSHSATEVEVERAAQAVVDAQAAVSNAARAVGEAAARARTAAAVATVAASAAATEAATSAGAVVRAEEDARAAAAARLAARLQETESVAAASGEFAHRGAAAAAQIASVRVAEMAAADRAEQTSNAVATEAVLHAVRAATSAAALAASAATLAVEAEAAASLLSNASAAATAARAVAAAVEAKAAVVATAAAAAAEASRKEARLTHDVLHDELTGLANRRLLVDRLTQALARAGRSGMTVAVMYLDLDGFKSVNDTLGHAAGDQLLVGVARRLQKCLRETDTAARVGGDEFVVVCEDLSHPSDGPLVAGRLETALAAGVMVGDLLVPVLMSVGIAVSGPASQPLDMLAEADTAMYRAKGGRG